MALDIKHFVLSHLIWVGVVAAAIFGVVAHEQSKQIAERDKQIEVDQKTVKSLQDQITQNNAAIVTMQQQISQRDANAAKQIQQLAVLVSKVQTVPQAVQALPQVSSLPSAPIVQ